MTSILPLNCPTCGKALPEGRKTPTFPFCCPRCKMVDLGRWFSGDYRVSEKFPREEMDFHQGLDLQDSNLQNLDLHDMDLQGLDQNETMDFNEDLDFNEGLDHRTDAESEPE